MSTAHKELFKPITSRHKSHPLEEGALLPNIKLAESAAREPGVRAA